MPNFANFFVLRGPTEQAAIRRREAAGDMARRVQQSPVGEHTRNVQRFVTLAVRIGHLATLASALGLGLVGTSFLTSALFRGLMTVEKASRAAASVGVLGVIGRASKTDFEAARFQDPFDTQQFLQPDTFEAEELSPLKVAYAAARVGAEYLGLGLTLAPAVGFLSSLITESPLGVPLEAAYSILDPVTTTALDVIRDSPIGFLSGQTFTLEEHLTFTVGTQLAWEIASPWIQRSPLPRTLAHFLDRPIPLTTFHEPVAHDALADLGVDLLAPPRWPIKGEPSHYIWREHAPILRAQIEQTVAELYTEHRDKELGDLLFGSMRHISRMTLQTLSGNPNAVRTGLSPLSRLLAGYIERPFIPPDQATPEVMQKLFRLGLAVQVATGRPLPDRVDLLDALKRARAEEATP